ncbi:Succinyl-CoA:acetate CoA-transferase [Alcanivorax sp. ALC70]|nr:Succinyl-CoA:acetate CoA-transferase [Alcanivorax sp. ALC70]
MIEVAGITEQGALIPSSSIGNNKTWIDLADRVILEVNHGQSAGLDGMHDVYYGTALPPHRQPIPLTGPLQRIGERYLHCPPEKITAVVETNAPDRNSRFSEPDEASRRIAGHLLEFFSREVDAGRLPANLLPLQSGVGNIANAVLAGLADGPFENLTAYTEVLQDGMLSLLKSGKLASASATAFSLSPDANRDLAEHIDFYRDRIVLRPRKSATTRK